MSVYAETWSVDYFKYAQFNGDVHFFGLNSENCQFKLKFGT